MRRRLLSMTIFVIVATGGLWTQQTNSGVPVDNDFLPAGPFLFEPGMVRPSYMDAFGYRPLIKSPDGNAQITITGPRESLKAWVTLQFLGQYMQGLEYRVWPVEGGSVAVLWRPDSQAFAVTDNRYANASYVLVCGTEFRIGENEPGLGVPITDLTPIVRKAFEGRAREYYKTDNYDIPLFYAKVLRWIANDELLIGVSARTSGPAASRGLGVREWDFGYLVDKVVREVDKDQLLSEYKIKVPNY